MIGLNLCLMLALGLVIYPVITRQECVIVLLCNTWLDYNPRYAYPR